MRIVAKVVSVIFNPLLYATLYFAALVAAGLPILPCVISWCFIVIGPAALLLFGLRLGFWSDIDVVQVRERRTYLPWAALSVAAAAAAALGAHFTYPLRLSAVGIFIWLGASAVVSLFSKASLHVGGTTGIVGLVWVLFGPAAGLALVWTPFLVAWARLHLKKHDLVQVALGFGLGVLAVVVAVAIVP